MTTALKYATVRSGKIVALNDAFPPHELKENQFELTEQEFYLLKSIICKKEEDIIGLAVKIVDDLVGKLNNHEKSK